MLSVRSNIRCLYVIKMAKWFMLTMPILMLYYKDQGFSNAQSFQLKAFYSVAIVIFEIPSGYVADVLGRRKTLIIGAILGTLGFLIYATTGGFLWFLVAEITLGIGQSFISGADSALLYDTLKYHNRTDEYVKYEGRNYTVGNFSEAVAGALGGLIATWSLHLPFVFQTAIAFAAVPAALLLVEPPAEKRRESPGWADIFGIVRYAAITNRRLRYNLLISAMLGTATLTMAWTYQLYLKDIGFENYAIGIAHAGLNLIVGFTTLFAHRVESRLMPRRTIWLISGTITGVFCLLGFVESAWALLLLACFYMARGIATPVLKYYVNRITESDIRATVLSLRSLIIRLLFAGIAPLYGWFADLHSRQDAMKLLGISFALLVGLSIFLFFRTLGESRAERSN